MLLPWDSLKIGKKSLYGVPLHGNDEGRRKAFLEAMKGVVINKQMRVCQFSTLAFVFNLLSIHTPVYRCQFSQHVPNMTCIHSPVWSSWNGHDGRGNRDGAWQEWHDGCTTRATAFAQVHKVWTSGCRSARSFEWILEVWIFNEMTSFWGILGI